MGSAIGTIAAVIVALSKDALLGWRRKPQLVVTCTKEEPLTSKTPIIVKGNAGLWHGEGYYIRVRVENKGKTRAEKVQVHAAALQMAGPDGQFTPVPGFILLNAKWSNSQPDTNAALLDGISPNMPAYCDILALCDPGNPYQSRPAHAKAGVTIAELQLEVAPLSGSNLLAPGTYRIILRIAAANAAPIDKTLTFTHTGAWFPDDARMRRECLGVTLS